MSQENVEIVRRIFDTIDQSGWDAAFASGDIDQDCEVTFKSGPQSGTHKGLEQVQAVIGDVQGGFETWLVEPLEAHRERRSGRGNRQQPASTEGRHYR